MDPNRNRLSQTTSGNSSKNDHGTHQTSSQSRESHLQAQGDFKSAKKRSVLGALQDCIDKSSDCFLGLEYVLEVSDSSATKQSYYYYCVLCQSKCDYSRKAASCAAWQHLLALPHKMKYLREHWPTCYKQLCKVSNKNCRRMIISKIAEGIEKSFGRMKIMGVEKREFEENRKHYHLVVRKGKHFEETPSRTYESLVRKCLDIKGGPFQLKKFLKIDEGQEETSLPSRGSVFDRLGGNSTVNNSDNAPKQMPEDVLDQIDRDFERYFAKPDEYPQYSEEWSKFWKKKYTQLKARGQSLATYDFEPEWQAFWNQRLKQLYVEAKENASKMKIASTTQIEPAVNSENLPEQKPVPEPVPRPEPVNSGNVPEQKPRAEPVPRPEPVNSGNVPEQKPAPVPRPEPVNSGNVPEQKPRAEPVNTTSLNIKDTGIKLISVLRLLVALEDHLGSLGPKVMDLLSQALVKENERAKSSDDLMNENNSILLKSVSEKLKGQLEIGLVSGSLENAFRTVITKIDKLFKVSNKGNNQQESEIIKGLKTLPGLSEAHRNKILEAICRHTQGKTQITEEELTKYITDLIKEIMTKTPSTCKVSGSYEEDKEKGTHGDEDPFSDFEDLQDGEDNSGVSVKKEAKEDYQLDGIPISFGTSVKSTQKNEDNLFTRANFVTISDGTQNTGNFSAPTNFTQSPTKPNDYTLGSSSSPSRTNYNPAGYQDNFSSDYSNFMRDGPRTNQSLLGRNNFEEKEEQNNFIPQRIEESIPSSAQLRMANPRNDQHRFSRWDSSSGGDGIEFDSTGYLRTSLPSAYPGGLYQDYRRGTNYLGYSPSKFRRLE